MSCYRTQWLLASGGLVVQRGESVADQGGPGTSIGERDDAGTGNQSLLEVQSRWAADISSRVRAT
jgi:hypothetical protein